MSVSAVRGLPHPPRSTTWLVLTTQLVCCHRGFLGIKQHHEAADQIKISSCLSRNHCLQTPPDSETQFFLFLFPFLLPPQAVKPSRIK